MLVGRCAQDLIEAAQAERGKSYSCPSPACGGQLVLKKGRIISAHFAHRPPFHCQWGAGETLEHRIAKTVFKEAFEKRGLAVKLEQYTPFADGMARRADLLVTSPGGTPVAFEFQKTNIGLPEIETRAFSYANHGYAQIWIPVVRKDFWKEARKTAENSWAVERYVPSEFEKWISGLYFGKGYWMFDPSSKTVVYCRLGKLALYREGGTRYQDEEEQFTDGYYYNSKRFRRLTFSGPFDPSCLKVALSSRRAHESGNYRWPEARIARLINT